MSSSIKQSISDINFLLDDLSRNYDVNALKNDIISFMEALAGDKARIEVLTTQIAEAKKVAVDPQEYRELVELNESANAALKAAKDQLERYRATLDFLKSISALKSGDMIKA